MNIRPCYWQLYCQISRSRMNSRNNYCCQWFPGPANYNYCGTKNIHTSSYLQQAVVPKNVKGKSVSSQHWLKRHLNDPYVARAKKLGYRARSAFKLLELDDKFKILKPGQLIVECGAAPGAWTQVAVEKINSSGQKKDMPEGKIISVDLLNIEPIPGAILLPASDFTHKSVQQEIIRLFQDHNNIISEETIPDEIMENSSNKDINHPLIDGVLSDMAPNASGFSETDHYRIVTLVNSALDFALQYGKPGSFFIAKIWNGHESQNLLAKLKQFYKTVKITKPESSRDNSSELFLVAKIKL